MPNVTVVVRGSSRRTKVLYPSGVTTVTTDTGNAMVFSETRPVRVRTRRPPNWLEPTGYVFNSSTNRSPSGTYKFGVPGSVVTTVSGDLMSGVPDPSDYGFLPTTGLKAAAEVKALLALKDQSVNLGVAFAEAQQTANLIGSTASRVGMAYNSFKRKQFRRGMQQLGASGRKIPNSWLEAQYAWKPLLSDVYGAAEALAAHPRTNWTVTGKGSSRVTRSDDEFALNSGCGAKWVLERLSGAYVRLDFIPGNVFLDSLTRVGMTNPFEVVWEKVPFSFVVDWFLPIGNWLSSLDATLGWEFRAGSCSILRREKRKVTAAPPSGTYLGGKFSGSFKAVTLDRTVYSSSPLPSPPRLKNPLSLGHMANGLSLLATAFGR